MSCLGVQILSGSKPAARHDCSILFAATGFAMCRKFHVDRYSTPFTTAIAIWAASCAAPAGSNGPGLMRLPPRWSRHSHQGRSIVPVPQVDPAAHLGLHLPLLQGRASKLQFHPLFRIEPPIPCDDLVTQDYDISRKASGQAAHHRSLDVHLGLHMLTGGTPREASLR